MVKAYATHQEYAKPRHVLVRHFCCCRFLGLLGDRLTRCRLCRFGGHGSGEIVDEADEREMRCAGAN